MGMGAIVLIALLTRYQQVANRSPTVAQSNVGRQSANTLRSTLTKTGPTVGQVSANYWPTVGQQLANSRPAISFGNCSSLLR